MTRPGGGRPALSVVLPVYNVEAYLGACLDSILSQSYTDFEVVLVDDGSPDGSRAIAEEYAARDARVRIVSRPNGGLGAARNTGVREATGSHLTFVDSDDLVPPGAFEALMSAASSGAEIVCGSVRRFNATGEWSPGWVEEVHGARRTGIVVRDFLPLLRNLYTWNKVFRRNFWDRCGLEFREGVAYEDQPIITQLFAAATAVDVVREVVYLYRVREDRSSISQQIGSIKDLRDRIAAWEVTRTVLLRDHGRELYEGWLQTLFDAHVHWYLNDLALVGDDYWRELRAAVVDFTDDGTPEIWAATPPHRRVPLELVRQDRRADVQAYVEAGGRSLERWPGTPTPAGLLVDLPLRGDPRLPDELFLLPTDQVRLEHRVDWLRWSPEGLVVRGWAFPRQVDLRVHSLRTTLVLRDASGGEHRVPARAGVSPVQPPPVEDPTADYWPGTYEAVLPLDLLISVRPGASWRVDAEVEVRGLVVRGAVHEVLRSAAWSACGAGPGLRLVPEVAEDGSLRVAVEESRLDVTGLEVDGRRLTLRLSGPAADKVASVELACPELDLAVTASPRRGKVRLTLPEHPLTSSANVWSLTFLRGDGSRVRANLADPGFAEPFHLVPGGAVEVRRTRRNLPAVRTWGAGAVADVAEVRGEELVVAGHAFGGLRAARLVAGGFRGPEVPVARSRFEARLPLRQQAWRFGPLPLALGDHDLSLVLLAPDDRETIVPLHATDTLAATEPRLVTGLVEGRVSTRGAGTRLRLTVQRPLGAARGRAAQHALRAAPAGPLVPGVLIGAGDDGLAVLRELRRRGLDLPVHWAVPDPSFPVPDGAQPVVVNTADWYALLGSVSHVVDAGWRRVQHAQPDGQVVVQLGDGVPDPALLGVHAWRAEGLPEGAVANRLAQVARWDLLVSASPGLTPALRAAFGYDGRVAEVGLPRHDLAADPSLREAVRRGLGIGDQRVVLLDVDVDLAKLADLLPADMALLTRRSPTTEPAAGPPVVDVTGYPYLADLLAAADAVVAGAGSLLYDAAAWRRPLVVHAAGDEPAVPTGPSAGSLAGNGQADLPGSKTRDVDELAAVLADLHTDLPAASGADAAAYDRFVATYLPLADGRAAARLVDQLFG